MLNVNLIRNQILVISEPGPLAESVIRSVCREAERYAREGCLVGAAGVPDLGEVRAAREILQELVKGGGKA